MLTAFYAMCSLQKIKLPLQNRKKLLEKALTYSLYMKYFKIFKNSSTLNFAMLNLDLCYAHNFFPLFKKTGCSNVLLQSNNTLKHEIQINNLKN